MTTPNEISAVAQYLTDLANNDMANADPNDKTAFYARAVIHACALNLAGAAAGMPRLNMLTEASGFLAAQGAIDTTLTDTLRGIHTAARTGQQ